MYNFSAGPACLPKSVTQKASSAIEDLKNSGIGLLEHSHRGKQVTEVFEEAESSCRRIANISDDYAVLFLQGGASMQFCMLAMNFLSKGKTADYVDTGSWSAKAIKEAKLFGNVHVAGSSKEENYTFIPDALQSSESPVYTHITSNNTISGTEWKNIPAAKGNSFLACDASSNMFSKPIDVSKYGLIYAGAQKNLGPAGVTLVILKKSLLEQAQEKIPTLLSYKTHVEKESRFNTPPVFCVYTMGKVFEWIEEQGGLSAIEKQNQAKAKVIYDYLDQSALFKGTAKPESRSLMNITFRAAKEDLEPKFIEEALAKGFSGLKGHRSVGGMRASVYNAFPKKGCDDLVEFMSTFEKTHS